ncbi:hypothetical protein BXY75_2258 [Ulvibacter antarcticus]|uniref:Uncharacterized protein n=1 Tax=Ulvibacter antarcticus TaxID=442714 RepID=A0A3L9YLI8_9FLAO|nr:hypothetical protein BXY75_2258 [Ulvibacter antarcticus]
MAAIAGSYYIRKVPSLIITKYFVYLLWVTFFIEIFSLYAVIGYYSDYRYFSFVENTNFSNNYWVYNIFFILSFAFYIYFFRFFIKGNMIRQILKYAIVAYIILGFIYLVFSDVFFKGTSHFTSITGTLLLLSTIFIFYFELLRSDVLLNLKRFLPIYISVGALIFHLCVTPLDIFSEYFQSENRSYVQLRIKVLLYGNIFLYSTYILGFIICSRRKKSY